jgi:hypothetical protein
MTYLIVYLCGVLIWFTISVFLRGYNNLNKNNTYDIIDSILWVVNVIYIIGMVSNYTTQKIKGTK